jgi:hypothetical protein
MLHLFHIDLIVVLVCADPFDPYDALFEIDGNDQSIIIPLNVEHDSVCRDDAGGRMAAPDARQAPVTTRSGDRSPARPLPNARSTAPRPQRDR